MINEGPKVCQLDSPSEGVLPNFGKFPAYRRGDTHQTRRPESRATPAK
jgi:hypothetical protein